MLHPHHTDPDRHLKGFRSVLNVVTVEPDGSDVGRRAAFWNFVRADYQASYIRHEKTLVDPEDFKLWQEAGLQIQPDGQLYASSESVKNDVRNARANIELVAHTLLWLVLRVINHIAGDSEVTSDSHWDQLSEQLDTWHATLPHFYRPCAQIGHPRTARLQRDGTSIHTITESFFSIDVCAAALQLYHFARILLLLHRPPGSTRNNSNSNKRQTGGMVRSSRLAAYREVAGASIKHAHAIIGIALGRPNPAIRVEMLLPLFLAGATLEADAEREIVLELLQAIETDTGCATQARCQQLVQDYWGWQRESQPVP